MTANDFRKLALALPEAGESAHMNHPDFRVRNKIFATLGYPDAAHGMVKLTPAQQKDYIAGHPTIFAPAAGAWGRGGATTVCLKKATAKIIRPAMFSAWMNSAPKELVDKET